MIRKNLFVFVLLMIANVMFAQSGSGCGDPIIVGDDYEGNVAGPCVLWYTVGTYDLPLEVTFVPKSGVLVTGESTNAPKIEVDFTCDPGKYDDPKLQNLLMMAEVFDVKPPFTLNCTEDTYEGKQAWSLVINETYRDNLTKYGINYNVQAFVKVTFREGGMVMLNPDHSFQDCFKNSISVNLGDQFDVDVNDAEQTYILPYSAWTEEDSIRYVWTGTEPLKVWLANDKCDFTPSYKDANVSTAYTIPAGGKYKLTKKQINDAVEASDGIFYAKAISESAGKLTIERCPKQEAVVVTPMQYGKSISLSKNDTNKVFSFPTTWSATQFIAKTEFITTMYISNVPRFGVASANTDWRRVYTFDKENNTRALYLSEEEMQSIAKNAKDGNLYVRFDCNAAVVITPNAWDASDCAKQSTLIKNGDKIGVVARVSDDLYRMRYEDWAGFNLTLQWNGRTQPVDVYFADNCSFELSKTDPHVIHYLRINRAGTAVIDPATLEAWKTKTDADGYIYVKAVSTANGNLTITSDKPADVDPEPEPEPEPIRPIALQLNTPINVLADNVDQAYYFTQDWANQSVEFEANTADSIVAYFGTTPDFDIFNADADYVAAYPFFIEDNQSRLQLSTKQLSTLLTENASDTIFVLFYSYNATQVTPILWNACACVENSLELMSTDQKMLLANNYNTVYRIKYNQWQNYDVRLLWNSDVTLSAYLGYTCDFKLTVKNKYVLNKSQVDISPNDSMIIGEEVRTKAIDEGKLPDDGFLYFKFYSTDSGILTTSHPDKGNTPGVGTGVDGTVVGDALRRVICTPDGHIYILVDGNRYTLLGEQL